MILRPYQDEAKAEVILKLATHHSTLVEMATGLGKTVLFASIADDWPGRVLVIAHRDELIRQAADKIERVTGKPVAVEMGRERALDSLYGTKVTVGSIQSLARVRRRQRFHPDHFSLVVIDEGHHAAAATYREVLDYFGSAKRLFVTATPKRKDGVALETVCQSVAYQYGIEPAIDDGWLVPVRQTVVRVEGLDYSKARTVAEDFNEADLERILLEEEPLHQMVSSGFKLAGSRQALWFCATVAHAKATAAVLAR
jgi:superfamily II DNA or RNA helicase